MSVPRVGVCEKERERGADRGTKGKRKRQREAETARRVTQCATYKIVKRVKFKFIQIRLILKVLSFISKTPSRRYLLSRKLQINWTWEEGKKKDYHGEQLNHEIKSPLLVHRHEGRAVTSKPGPCQVDKFQIVEEQLPVVMRSTHARHDFSLFRRTRRHRAPMETLVVRSPVSVRRNNGEIVSSSVIPFYYTSRE